MNKILATLVAVTIVSMMSGVGVALAEIPEEVLVGGVFDITGEWSEEGSLSRTAAQYAVDDFNAYLVDIGAEWQMKLLIEDSQANGSVAFDKVSSLNGRGADMILGMGYSSHLLQSADYVENHNMLVISHASQAANLEIDDNMFRLVPSDSNQAPAVVAMIENAGIEVLIPFIRDDVWGNGMLNAVKEQYSGTIPDEFKYATTGLEFSAGIATLDLRIGDLIDEHGADKVGILYVGTDEFLTIIEGMKLYSNVDDVRWFSTNTQSTNQALFENEAAAEFIDTVMLTVTKQGGSRANHVTAHVDDILNATSESAPSQYTYASYDSVWLLGVTILQTGTTDIQTLVNAIPLVAEHMIGSAGPLRLTDSGDLAYAEYSIQQVSGGEFVTIYDYDPATDSLIDVGN